VEVTPQATTVETIDQHIFFVEHKDKRALLEHLLRDKSAQRVLVFTRTKHGANKVVKQLGNAGIVADAIHGNKSQTARERALEDFRKGKVRILVATDIAARGLDVEGITHVVNYDLPNIPESYVHRIGRTARAGASGIAYSFCAEDERPYLRDIERTIRMTVPVVHDHPYFSPLGLPTAGRQHQSASRPQPAPRQQNPSRNGQSASSNGNNAPARKRRRRRSRANTGNRVDYPV
jgi:ATP-dependent RNA helicase RhlE